MNRKSINDGKMMNQTTESQNSVAPTHSNQTVDLDSQIPNYANTITNTASKRVDEVKNVFNNAKSVIMNYLLSKWNETKLNMQKASIGYESTPNQMGGKRKKKKKTKKKKSMNRKSRKNRHVH